jgi:hypothetical protein
MENFDWSAMFLWIGKWAYFIAAGISVFKSNYPAAGACAALSYLCHLSYLHTIDD